MIRINLLPQAKRAAGAPAVTSTPAQVWLAVYFGGLVVWGLVLGAVYMTYSWDLDEQNAKNKDLQRQIDAAVAQSAGLDEVKARIEKSKQLEEVVAQLQRARLGPARVLMEMSKILSPGEGPTVSPERLEEIRRENPVAGYNPNWDGRKLWLTAFEEEERACKIKGIGKTNEDVAEFIRRLALSDIFEDVSLTKTESMRTEASELQLIGFELACKVKY